MNRDTLSNAATHVETLGDLQIEVAEMQAAIEAMQEHLFPLQSALPHADVTTIALNGLHSLVAQISESMLEIQAGFAREFGVDAIDAEYRKHVQDCEYAGRAWLAKADYIAIAIASARQSGTDPMQEAPADTPRRKTHGHTAKTSGTGGPGRDPGQMVFSAVGFCGCQ
jgi:hypothetical protein